MSTIFKLSFSSYITTSDSTNNVQAVRNFKKFKTEESRMTQILFQGKKHTIHFRTNFKYKFERCYFFVSLKKLQNASNVLIKHVRFDKASLAKRMRIRFSPLKKLISSTVSFEPLENYSYIEVFYFNRFLLETDAMNVWTNNSWN